MFVKVPRGAIVKMDCLDGVAPSSTNSGATQPSLTSMGWEHMLCLYLVGATAKSHSIRGRDRDG